MPEIYHVLSRGVDKRKIFLDNQDYFRFIHDLFELNNQNCVNTTFYRFQKSNDIASRKIKRDQPRKLLVDIYAFAILPNHYHLLLSPRVETGISKFMKKINMGYAKYFNQKYDRTGTLFEGRYKSIPVTAESHFIHLPYYIHLNPLDVVSPEWRQRKLKDFKRAINFLENYRWSSHLDYLGKKNFPSILNKKLLLELFENEKEYQKSIYDWLKDLNNENIEEIKDVILE